jgi:hypothetical protein
MIASPVRDSFWFSLSTLHFDEEEEMPEGMERASHDRSAPTGMDEPMDTEMKKPMQDNMDSSMDEETEEPMKGDKADAMDKGMKENVRGDMGE